MFYVPFFTVQFTPLQLPPSPLFNNPVPEQAFLAKNYDEYSKKSDRDPRGAFRNPTDFAGAAAGIVGPLGSSSFNLPNVERALSEMESGIGPANHSTYAIDGYGLILQGVEKFCHFACQVLSASGVRFCGSGNWVREYLMTTGTKYKTIISGIGFDA